MSSLEFLLGLLDEDEPHVGSEDLGGAYGEALRTWQEMGFLGAESAANPVAGCPHCGEGVPYRLGERYVCNGCRSEVDVRGLLLWPIDRDAFLRWLAQQWQLRGEVRRIEDRLWQLGTSVDEDGRLECFFRRSGELSALGKTRLSAFRQTLVLSPLTPPEASVARSFSLLETLRMEGSLELSQLSVLLRIRGAVRFDIHSGALWVGDARLGEIPIGSKEFFFFQRLAEGLDHFVSYADLKHFVLRQSGGSDAADEATFCQGMKSRIKKKWIAKIDLLLATTNKGDGYRLRARAEL